MNQQAPSFKTLLLTLAFWLLAIGCVQAQSIPRINLNEDGTSYIKPSVRVQLWARALQTNPGTTLYNEPTDYTFDVSLRRIRFGFIGQATPKLYFFLLLGGNNMNHITGKNFSIDVLDAHLDYHFSDAFQLGFGKHAWQGSARASTRSTVSFMALDAPTFTLNTVGINDDLIRQLGVYAKGQIGKFDYRLAANKPYPAQTTSAVSGAIPDIATYADTPPRTRFTGYFKYMFLDKESNKAAFHSSTYLGKKKVLNIGAGFKYQAEMMWSLAGSDTILHPLQSWAIDVFYDTPLNEEKGTALTTYLAYFNYDFGPNYVRNLGVNNPTTGIISSQASFNGRGNSFPMMGSSRTVFFQMGYLMNKELLSKGSLQPNIAIQYSDFDLLDDPMIVYDLAINWLFGGHLSKITLGYQNRPIFYERNNGIFSEERRGMLIMQYQIGL